MFASGAIARISRLISLIGGSFSAIVAVLWSLVYVDRLVDEGHALSDAKDAVGKNIEALNAAEAQYFIANQQGDLIFILALQGNARSDLAALIYQANMLDREVPVRNMIGALAVAGQVDYREAYDAYQKLNAEAREHLEFPTFAAVKAREQEIVRQGQNLAANLLTRQFEIRKALNENDAARRMAQVIGSVLSIISTVLLLAANIVVKREESARSPEAHTAAD